MSTSPTIPMVNAQGEAYDIPLSQMPDAVRSGLQTAVDMKHAGTGERYTIPSAKYQDALSGGLVPDHAASSVPVPAGLQGPATAAPPTWGSTPSEILSTIGQHAKNLVMGPVNAFTAPPQNAQEQGVSAATSTLPGGSQMSLGLNRLLGVGNSVQSFKNAQNLTGDAKVQSYEDAVPIVGPWAKQIETDVANKGAVAGMAGLATDILGTKAIVKAAGPVGRVIGSGVNNIAERAGGYTSPVIEGSLQDASKVATAIRPQTGIGPDFEANLKTQLPGILDYANRTANPMHSQWELGTAAKGLAKEGLDHYNTNILGPHADVAIPMDGVPEYQGKLDSEGRASLQDVNDRIGSINDYIRAAQRNAKTGGQQLSATEQLGLDTEASKLRNRLYSELGQRTGIDPGEIQSLRTNYGQQFALADTIDAARRSRLGQIGATDEHGSGIALNKAGLVDKALTRLRGGQQYLADANFRDAVGPFQPSPTNYPQPVAPDPQMGVVNRLLAQQEFMHQNALSQAAQDAATARSTATTAYRTESKKAFGESMRARSASLRGGLSGN
jgi:hypothetical protein